MCPGKSPRRPTDGGGSADGGSTGDRVASGRLRTGILLGSVLALCLVSVVALAGVGGATVPGGVYQQNETTDDGSDDDTQGPTVGNLTKLDDETIELVFTDDTDVDESTIGEGDFLLSAGRIENVTVVENGPDAHARIHLMDPVNVDEIRVDVPADAVISDASGNPLQGYDDVSRTVDDMDGVAPFVTDFRARPTGNGTVHVRLRVNEGLAGLTATVDGPWSDRLTLADISRGDQPNEYETTIDPGRDGEYRVSVVEVLDAHGNGEDPRVGSNATVDTTAPEAIAVVDLQASTGRTYTFDASRSTDLSALANVTWALGDGTNATGERVSHEYAPGNYTVTVRVADARGNAATDDLFVVVGEGNASLGSGSLPNASATVRLTGGGSAASSAMVDVSGAVAGDAVRLPTGTGRTVAAGEAVTLERLSVTPARNASYRLGVQVDGPAAVGDAATATGGTALGGVTVVHDVPDAAIANATLTVAVDRAAVAAADGEPSAVRLYRRHDGDWSGLETTLVERSNATLRYRAVSPGFSRFALVIGGEAGAATPTGASDATPATATAGPTPAATTSSGGGGGWLPGLGGLLGFLPLGLLDALVRYVGSVVLAAFLLLKSLALAMGY